MKKCATILCFLLAFTSARAERANIGPFALGGRAEYSTNIERDAVPFTWNDATHSLRDRTRFMLDMEVGDARYGDLYLKGAALWDDTRQSDVRKRFRFEQGDYLWARDKSGLDFSFRLFANERRFFVNDGIAPTLDDDSVANAGHNGGIRLDGKWSDRISATGLVSVLGNDFDKSRRVAYLGARYADGFANVGMSYLFNDLGEYAPRNHAVFKVEAAAAYKRAYLVLAYQQSQLADRGLFLPGGRFDWDTYDGGNFAAALPDGGAFQAQLRATEVQVAGRARLRIDYRYAAAGPEFFNDLGWNRRAEVGHTLAASMQDTEVDLNGRLRYHNSERFALESEEREFVDGSLWGALRAGIWFIARGAFGHIDDDFGEEDDNFIHLGAERRIRETRAGAHVMWRDLGTAFSERRFAMDAKFPVSPNWGFYFRVIASRDFDVAEAAYARLDFRPNDRVFATFSYGRSDFGDGPFLLEDADIDLARGDTAVYRITIRGDF